MKKRIIKIIIVIITIINIIAASFIFFDIQLLQAPETTININIIEINSEEAIIYAKIDVNNPNSFEIIIKDFESVTTIPDGTQIAYMKIEGGNIPPNEKKTFDETFNINFNGHSPELLNTRLTGTVGMKTGFIQKTIRLAMNVVTSMENVIKQLAPPMINIEVDFEDITPKKINITTKINAYNPNTFNMIIENMSILMTTETGENVGEMNFPKVKLKAKENININSSGSLHIEALNAEALTMNLTSPVTMDIAGFCKTLPLSIDVKINSPDLKSLLSSNLPTEAVIRGDYYASIWGIIDDITLETRNPNNIDLIAKDITVHIYRIDSNTKRLIATGDIEGGILKAKANTILKGEVIIPYHKLFIPPPGGKFIPDWLEVELRANITIQGLKNYIWVGTIAYSDLYIFQKNTFISSPKEIDWK
jgi:LEA14-like dessication related protein